MKNYIRGFGIGVLFVTILFAVIRKPEVLTDAEVQSRAARLGMLTEQEAEEKRLSAIRESELKWKDELEKQKEDYEALLRQKGDADESQKQENADNSDADNSGADNSGTDSSDADGSKPDNSEADKADGQKKDGQNEEEDSESEKENKKEEDGTDTPAETGDTAGNEPNQEGNEVAGLVKIEIVSGMTAEQVARMLEEADIIDSASELKQYLKAQNRQTLIQVGTFELRQGEELETVVDTITRR